MKNLKQTNIKMRPNTKEEEKKNACVERPNSNYTKNGAQ